MIAHYLQLFRNPSFSINDVEVAVGMLTWENISNTKTGQYIRIRIVSNYGAKAYMTRPPPPQTVSW